MSQSSYSQSLENFRLVAFCPLCNAQYQPNQASILEQKDDANLIYVECDQIVSEKKDYQKYFEMFKWGTKRSEKFKNSKGEFFLEFSKKKRDFFSDLKFAGTSLFPKSDPEDFLTDPKYDDLFKPIK